MAQDKSYLPVCWSDELRMDSMFSDFRNREANPSDWDGKFHFWQNLVNDWCRVSNRLTFNFTQARNAFSRNGRTPRGLKTVEQQMFKESSIMTIDSYIKMCSDQGWLSWSWDVLVKKPITSTWSFISKAIFQTPVEAAPIQYINCDIIKEKASAIIERHRFLVEKGDEDDTIALKALAKCCKDICGSEKDLELCCMWLKKEKKLTIIKDNNHVVIKFFGNDAKSTELSPMEKAVVQLRLVRKTLEHQIGIYENDIDKYTNEARSYLKAGSRTLAKSSLQKKKQSENMLQKKEKTLENIELLLSRLQDASTQKSVLEALQAGSAAFKLDQKMDLDRVDETMAAVQETLEMQEEIQEAVSFNIGPVHDTMELEQELQDIMANEEIGNDESEAESEEDGNSINEHLRMRLNKLRVPDDCKAIKLPSPPTELGDRKTAKRSAVKM